MPRKTKSQSKNGVLVFLLLVLGLVAAAYLVLHSTEFRRQAFNSRNSLTDVVCTQNGVMTLPAYPASREGQFALDPTNGESFVVGRSWAVGSNVKGIGKLPFVNGLGTATVMQMGGNSNPTSSPWAKGVEKDGTSSFVYSTLEYYDSIVSQQIRQLVRSSFNPVDTDIFAFRYDTGTGQTIEKVAYPEGHDLVFYNSKLWLFLADQDKSVTPHTDSTHPYKDRVVVYDITNLAPDGSGFFPNASAYVTSMGQYGNPLPSGYRLVEPHDVLVDPTRTSATSGYMYVLDQNSTNPNAIPNNDNKTVKMFTLDFSTGVPVATYVGTLGNQPEAVGSGNGQFYRPTGMALDKNTGLVYVVDQGNSRVQVFNPVVQNHYVGKFTVTPATADVEVDSQGNVFTNDVASIARYACTGGGTTPPTPTPTPTPPPGPSIVLSKTNVCQSVQAYINWTAYPGATGYEIRRCVDTTGTCTPNTIAANVSADARTFSQKLSTDQARAYRFRVRAKIGSGYSEYSNIQSLSYYLCDPGNDN